MYHFRFISKTESGATQEETVPAEHYTKTEIPPGGKPLGGIFGSWLTFELTMPRDSDEPPPQPGEKRLKPGKVFRIPEDGHRVVIMDANFNNLEVFQWPPRSRSEKARGKVQVGA